MTLTDDLPDDAVERAARALESTFAADAERFHGAIKWSAYARAALEAARYGEMRECLRRVLEWWPERSEDSNAAAVLYGGGFAKDIVKARALLSSIGEPNPDSGATHE